MPASTQLDIASATARQASPEHKRFATLQAKIAKARERLSAWHTQLPLFAQVHDEQAGPAIKALMATRRELAFEIERVLLSQRWSKTDAASLAQMICDEADSLLAASDEEDAELKSLHDRNSDVDYDDLEQQELDHMKSLLEVVGGVDLGDVKADSAEELLHRAREQMAQRAEQSAAAAAASAQAHARKHQPKRQTAAQKRAAEDAQRISQTVREVYRKLASALHPDRIADATARATATAQMQRANAAYEAGDLLALLELQLQVEQIDIAHAAGIGAEQVRHFNKVLAEQLRELEYELNERQHAFCMSYGLMTEQRLDPNKLGALLKEEMRDIAAAQYKLERTRRLLRGDPAAVKRWLKSWRAEQRATDFDDFF
jgi:hypothetical protein